VLEIKQVSKAFAGVPALREVSFTVARGEILCLLGPSGCGKTTLLRIVAGLERADSGQVLLAGVDLAGVPVHRRGLGLMFQEYALFPHKDVYGNVAFGLRMDRISRDQVDRRVRDALEQVGLGGFERRAVHELSGGEQQRVALARSLAPRPTLLMLDEPLGSLDRALREQLVNELRQILKSVGLTGLYVTHDQSEAFALGDRVAIMQMGCIEQIGRPETVYRHPASPFVARFLGMTNLLPGEVVNSESGRVRTPLGEFATAPSSPAFCTGQEVTVLLRPEAAQLVDGVREASSVLHGQVTNRSFRGAYYRLAVRHSTGTELVFELDGSDKAAPDVGDEVVLSLRPQAINLLTTELAEEPMSGRSETFGSRRDG
jgi:thiamine transport system ATP-binding protein/spermidine/putrescine transport system ATP-binding protein